MYFNKLIFFVGKDDKEKELCTTIPEYPLGDVYVGNYFECKKPVFGSFLSITLKQGTPRHISLCEVEVFQTKISKFTSPHTGGEGILDIFG